MNAEKESKPRQLTVCRFTGNDGGAAFPEIRLRGKWLKESGFESGQVVSIVCSDKKLIISTDGSRKPWDKYR